MGIDNMKVIWLKDFLQLISPHLTGGSASILAYVEDIHIVYCKVKNNPACKKITAEVAKFLFLSQRT
ncbi:hypothetical protein JCM21142_93650 [Saccharicrinis fermentans DSM 9555 = JCM 21142]|uniref:Uncharacterized protein n=1 Tax=Saccharicrinis fermentans DSM 9555 = JCM 21142 TaxID=869213 RepID=W7Y9B3_9BACT|nr:hypothetical protein JCM21142_93650 [Saccharicrinis fermentans DSM 9555 = JCM 21142]